MEQELVRLVFFSRNAIDGGRDAMAEQIARIWTAGRRNNERCQIAGALLFNAEAFAEVLEGERRFVEVTLKRIQRDKRHKDLQILSVEPLTKRLFPHWTMGYCGHSPEDLSLFGHYADMTGFDPRYLESDRILSLLRDIPHDEETQAAS